MNKLEKVLTGLAACLPETAEDETIGCTGCPYGSYDCYKKVLVKLPPDMVEDIRALLKAQKYHTVTVDFDLKNTEQFLRELANRVLDEYIHEGKTIREWIEQLNDKKPRLVKAEDFHGDLAYDGVIPCWKETRSPTRRNGWTAIVYGKWIADSGVARYWTGIPTDVQREATPWL